MSNKGKSYLYAFCALVEFLGGVYELIQDQYVIGIAFIVVAVVFTIKSVEYRSEKKSNQDS
jgi:magnesium-transporting ATPase (P-type)